MYILEMLRHKPAAAWVAVSVILFFVAISLPDEPQGSGQYKMLCIAATAVVGIGSWIHYVKGMLHDVRESGLYDSIDNLTRDVDRYEFMTNDDVRVYIVDEGSGFTAEMWVFVQGELYVISMVITQDSIEVSARSPKVILVIQQTSGSMAELEEFSEPAKIDVDRRAAIRQLAKAIQAHIS